MALFFAAAAALAMLIWRPGAGRVFALAIAFGLAEYARGHVLTGLPVEPDRLWAARQPAADAARLPVRRLRLSLLAVLLFASPAAILAPAELALARVAGATVLLAGVLLLVCSRSAIVWGERQARQLPRLPAPASACASCRPISTRPRNGGRRTAPRSSPTISISPSRGAAGLDGIAIVIWPETAVPFLLADSARGARRDRRQPCRKAPSLLAGSARLVEERDAQGALAAEPHL